MSIIAGIPTRGLVFSKTIDSVLRNQPDYILFAHSKPVPDAYNYLVDRFLDSRASHLWLIDDDMLLPSTILDDLLSEDVDVAFSDYPLETGLSANDEQLYGGLGCVLVKRRVFESGIRFRTDKGYVLPDMKPISRDPNKHGGQDVDFYVQAKEAGFIIRKRGLVDHLRIENHHIKGNNTQYEVKVL